MKTTLKILVSAAAVAFASQAFAVAELPASAKVDPSQCVLLSNDISVTLSAKVGAAYDCSTVQALIATVSSAGQTKSRTLPCAVVSGPVGATPTRYTGSCTSNTGTYTVTGPTVYSAGSLGGQVAAGSQEGATATTNATAAAAAASYLRATFGVN